MTKIILNLNAVETALHNQNRLKSRKISCNWLYFIRLTLLVLLRFTNPSCFIDTLFLIVLFNTSGVLWLTCQ